MYGWILVVALCVWTSIARAEGPDGAADAGAAEAGLEATGADDAGDGEEPAEEDAGVDDGTPPAEPDRVIVGVHVNDIQDVLLTNHTYQMDAYFWFKWTGDHFDPAMVEFINPNELWGHMVTPIYEEPIELDTGELYQVLRIQGRFSRKLPLYSYPFDRQALSMILEDSANDARFVVFEPDPTSPTMNPELTLPGYLIGKVRMTTENIAYPTAFGDPRTPEPPPYARVTVEVPISRPVFAYSVKLLVPVLAVIMCAGLMFLFSSTWVDARVGVGITALLSIVALQMTFNADLPDVGYLTLMDEIYVASYGYVIFGLGVVVWGTRMVEQQRAADADALNRRGLAASTVVFVAVLLVLVAKAMARG